MDNICKYLAIRGNAAYLGEFSEAVAWSKRGFVNHAQGCVLLPQSSRNH